MDTNGDRQTGYGDADYGINWGRGLVTLLLAIVVAAVLISMLPQ